jgi:hypothetical protein
MVGATSAPRPAANSVASNGRTSYAASTCSSPTNGDSPSFSNDAEFLRRINELEGREVGKQEPGLSHREHILANWDRIRDTLLIPYVERQRFVS